MPFSFSVSLSLFFLLRKRASNDYETTCSTSLSVCNQNLFHYLSETENNGVKIPETKGVSSETR